MHIANAVRLNLGAKYSYKIISTLSIPGLVVVELDLAVLGPVLAGIVLRHAERGLLGCLLQYELRFIGIDRNLNRVHQFPPYNHTFYSKYLFEPNRSDLLTVIFT